MYDWVAPMQLALSLALALLLLWHYRCYKSVVPALPALRATRCRCLSDTDDASDGCECESASALPKDHIDSTSESASESESASDGCECDTVCGCKSDTAGEYDAYTSDTAGEYDADCDDTHVPDTYAGEYDAYVGDCDSEENTKRLSCKKK